MRIAVLPVIAVLALALAACGDRAPDAAGGAASTVAPLQLPASDQPAEDVPPATAPVPATPASGNDTASAAGQARFDGYADARLGMTAAETRQAWDGPLDGAPGGEGSCHYLLPEVEPATGRVMLMVVDDRFVRYDIVNDRDIAPGGGRVGMDAAAIEALYAGRVTRSPHKYVKGASYLRVEDGARALVFETDGSGKVTRWRVGVTPPVDQVEGCS